LPSWTQFRKEQRVAVLTGFMVEEENSYKTGIDVLRGSSFKIYIPCCEESEVRIWNGDFVRAVKPPNACCRGFL
jgi:hypothetical protein